VEKQKIRDSIKAKIVKARGINLVQVRTEDLSVGKMAKKLRDLVALCNLGGLDMIVEFLDHVGLRYQRQEVERRLKAQKEAKAKQILTPTSACIG
jgi:thiamine monophosphate synthase